MKVYKVFLIWAGSGSEDLHLYTSDTVQLASIISEITTLYPKVKLKLKRTELDSADAYHVTLGVTAWADAERVK